ncbi:MAG: polymer-forming cytoskeletal protein [Myxococcota bacterium]
MKAGAWMVVAFGFLSATALAEEAAAPKISVSFRGSLRDGLRELASKGGINLVVTGDLDQPAEVYLQDVTAEEALTTVADAYQLEVHRNGSIWTLRPLLKEEQAAPSPPPPAPTRATERKEDGEVVGTGPVVIAEGQVVEAAVAYGGGVTVKAGAVVEGDVVAFGGDVELEPGAVVTGDAVSFGGQVRKAEEAVVEGDTVSMGAPSLGALVSRHVRGTADDERESLRSRIRLDRPVNGLSGFLLRFALLFGMGFLFVMFTPARMKQLETELRRFPVKCGLTGLLGAVALVPLTLLLIATFFGVPFAIALWLFLGLGVAMGFAALASGLGLRLPFFRRRKTQATVLAVGLLVLLVIAEVPVLGPLAMTFASLAALGAIIRTRFGQTPRGFPVAERIAEPVP